MATVRHQKVRWKKGVLELPVTFHGSLDFYPLSFASLFHYFLDSPLSFTSIVPSLDCLLTFAWLDFCSLHLTHPLRLISLGLCCIYRLSPLVFRYPYLTLTLSFSLKSPPGDISSVPPVSHRLSLCFIYLFFTIFGNMFAPYKEFSHGRFKAESWSPVP